MAFITCLLVSGSWKSSACFLGQNLTSSGTGWKIGMAQHGSAKAAPPVALLTSGITQLFQTSQNQTVSFWTATEHGNSASGCWAVWAMWVGWTAGRGKLVITCSCRSPCQSLHSNSHQHASGLHSNPASNSFWVLEHVCPDHNEAWFALPGTRIRKRYLTPSSLTFTSALSMEATSQKNSVCCNCYRDRGTEPPSWWSAASKIIFKSTRGCTVLLMGPQDQVS